MLFYFLRRGLRSRRQSTERTGTSPCMGFELTLDIVSYKKAPLTSLPLTPLSGRKMAFETRRFSGLLGQRFTEQVLKHRTDGHQPVHGSWTNTWHCVLQKSALDISSIDPFKRQKNGIWNLTFFRPSRAEVYGACVKAQNGRAYPYPYLGRW